jgi:hypothetical protein
VASLPPQINVGASRASLVGYLGAPDYETAEPEGLLMLYALRPGEDANVLNVLLVNNRVRWISWVFFPEPIVPR